MYERFFRLLRTLTIYSGLGAVPRDRGSAEAKPTVRAAESNVRHISRSAKTPSVCDGSNRGPDVKQAVADIVRFWQRRYGEGTRDNGAASVGVMAGLGCGIVALAMSVVLVIPLVFYAVLFGGSGACGQAPAAETSGQQQASGAANSIPKNYFDLYQRAAAEWNIPWNVLAAIGWIETKHGTFDAKGVHSGENYAGAGGPMQFLRGTFNRAKVDGNNDGRKDRYDPADAIFSAAKLIKLHIFPGLDDEALKRKTLTGDQLSRSIHRYNPTPDFSYRNSVLDALRRYAGGYVLGPFSGLGQLCTLLAFAGANAGPFGQRIAKIAASFVFSESVGEKLKSALAKSVGWKGSDRPYPYVWGAESPRDGFDCSGLAQYAISQASGGEIIMPRKAEWMFHSDKGVRVSRGQLAPGDLVFFNGSNPQHMGIYFGFFAGQRWMVEAQKSGTDVMFSQFDSRNDFVGALRVTPPRGMENQPTSSPGGG